MGNIKTYLAKFHTCANCNWRSKNEICGHWPSLCCINN